MTSPDDSHQPLATSDVTQPVRIRLGKSGKAAALPRTVMQNFDEAVKKYGDQPLLHQKILRPGQSVEKTDWTVWTFRQTRQQVDAFAKSLLALGCQKFDIVNILGFNSPEWFFSNFGAIAAGCVAAGIYATNNAEACHYISEHSEAKVVVCDGIKQLEKYYEISKQLPHLKALVMYGTDPLPADIQSKCSTPVYTFASFLKLGASIGTADLEARTKSWLPGETCTLIYTSGTTGPPKAAMITHDNITWTLDAYLESTRKLDNTDSIISYLPLSHIAAQMIDMHAPIRTGVQIYYAQPDALKGSLGATLKEVRPTVFFGVPRVWEKIYEKLQEVGRATTGIKKVLSTWAKKQAEGHWASLEHGSTTHSPLLYPLAKKLLKKAHDALGFDRCLDYYVAAAPIDVKILRYFSSIDVPIMEIFGQSESTGPHSFNARTGFKFGTVGRHMPGVETKLGDGDELCLRGRHVFAGYMKMEDKTKETIDPEGWLHSGDVVKIDSDTDKRDPASSGFITITGRIKELIITAGGENVPPVLIEEQLKAAMPALSNAMVIGDKRKFLTVLLCLQVEVDAEGVPSNKLTGNAKAISMEIGSTATTTDEARNDPKWKAYFDDGLNKANKKASSQAQTVGKWALLSTDFSEKGGELTPTLKLKRSVAAAKYQDVIEAMYA